jgi:hypothetical protein
MNIRHHLLRLLSVPLIIAVTGCVTSINPIEAVRAANDRRGRPEPESVWNRHGFWQRVGNEPPSYIPSGYAKSAPRTDKHGIWVVDKRDGKRLFVPNTPVDGKSPGVWKGEAAKVTHWPVRELSSTAPGIIVN